ncbi:hypothetical protein HHI36_008358 [Cryptolaemus montrouzieri]|uniref:Uncharacterized protein n=1 Tax=Cryptolaemus montrouzieri TaxID=559131 RepID=A0ABD2MSI1_9CUCU
MDCEKSDLHFEKIIGFKPLDNNAALLLLRDTTHPITISCIQKCHENKICESFVLNYKEHTCYWFKKSVDTNEELKLIADDSVAWFTKVCFRGKNCNGQLWLFERIPGALLIGNDTKTLPNKVTRNECQESCLLNKNFECKSAKFKIIANSYDIKSNTKGRCTLSNADRHLLPNSFRIARDDEEYFENQCSAENEVISKNTFCSYEEYGDVILQHVDIIYEEKTKTECETLCNNLKEFHCRGFSLRPTPTTKYSCLLHSEDVKIYGPRSLVELKNAFYYEKARCLNITVTCTEEYLTVTYLPEINFLGRMYMQGYSDHPECHVNGQGFNKLNLKLHLTSSQCGIIEAIGPNSRKLLSASLIIQYNKFIQTQGDRLIKIGCIFGNDSKLVVGTGVNVTPENTEGSSLINSTSSSNGENNLVQMKILDHYTGREISDTQIGQELDLIIESSSKENYDIVANHLVAMTANGEESILLIDDRGCPVDLNVFPALEKLKNESQTTLIGTFQAFKFSSSHAVRFSVIVQFCPVQCPKLDCEGFYRQKRAEIQYPNGTKILKLNHSEFENINSQFYKRPLEIMVIVRNQLAPDRLTFGDNKVLVAGYNYETNEVCVDYSLLMGLVISWVLIQVIFAIACIIIVRKYKRYYQDEYMRQAYEEYNKNFGMDISNMDTRRVHWADGDEMQ